MAKPANGFVNTGGLQLRELTRKIWFVRAIDCLEPRSHKWGELQIGVALSHPATTLQDEIVRIRAGAGPGLKKCAVGRDWVTAGCFPARSRGGASE
jgi:hypothetical protein